MSPAPATQTTQPMTDSIATRSPRTATPRSSATPGMMKAVAEARVGPTRPEAAVIITNAMPVPSAPRTSNASSGRGDQCARARSGTPSGAVRISATSCARQITGSAP